MGIMKPGHVGTPETPTTGEGVGLVGFWEALELDVPLEYRINGDRINGLFHLLINGV